MEVTISGVRNMELLAALCKVGRDMGVQTAQVVLEPESDDEQSSPAPPAGGKRKRVPSVISFAETDNVPADRDDEGAEASEERAKRKIVKGGKSSKGSSSSSATSDGSGSDSDGEEDEDEVCDASALRYPDDLAGKKTSKDTVPGMKQLLRPLVMSNPLIRSSSGGRELWRRFKADGYLCFRNLITAEDVLAAQAVYLSVLSRLGYCNKQGVLERSGSSGGKGKSKAGKDGCGITVSLSSGIYVEGKQETAIGGADDDATTLWTRAGANAAVQKLLHHTAIRKILALLAQGMEAEERCPCKPLEFRNAQNSWFRAKTRGEAIMEHSDYFYYKGYTDLLDQGDEAAYQELLRKEEARAARAAEKAALVKVKQEVQKKSPAKGGKGVSPKNAAAAIELDLSDSDEDDKDSDSSSDTEPLCAVCQMAQDDMILCDECGSAYHPYCLSPRLTAMPSPSDSFFGPCCCPRQVLGTCWVPLADVPLSGAGLAILPGSQTSLPNYDRALKNADVPFSYFSKGRGMTWHCGSAPRKAVGKGGKVDAVPMAFHVGDVVFFDSKVVHCTSKNSTDMCTMNLDFRWAIAPTGRANFGRTVQSHNLVKNTMDMGGEGVAAGGGGSSSRSS